LRRPNLRRFSRQIFGDDLRETALVFCLNLAVVRTGFQQRSFFGPRGHGKTFLDFFGWNGRRGDSSTRWPGSCRTNSSPDICAFGDYCHRLGVFAKATAAQGRSRPTFGCDLHATSL
jgi:hypothetical protein